MKLKADSFVVRVAYSTPFPFGVGKKPPLRVSVCSLFWTFWFKFLIMWPLSVVLLIMIFLPVVVAVGAFFAQRPAFFKSDDTKEPWVPYRHWPTVGGHRIWPITVIGPCVGAYLVWCLVRQVIQLLSFDDAFRLWCYSMAPFVLLLLAVWGAKSLARSGVPELCRERWRAFKQKACPIVTIESSNPTGGSD